MNPPADRRSGERMSRSIHAGPADSKQVAGKERLYARANQRRSSARRRRLVARRGKQERQSLSGQWKLVIYLAGDTPVSLMALENLKRICQEYLDGSYRIEVVDLLKRPEAAREEHIFVVPTVVRKRPLPVKKVFGDLTAVDAVVRSLELSKDQRIDNPCP